MLACLKVPPGMWRSQPRVGLLVTLAGSFGTQLPRPCLSRLGRGPAAVEFGLGNEVLRAQFAKALQVLLRQFCLSLGGSELRLRRTYCQRVILRIQRGDDLAGLDLGADFHRTGLHPARHPERKLSLVACAHFAGITCARVLGTHADLFGTHRADIRGWRRRLAAAACEQQRTHPYDQQSFHVSIIA